MIDYSHRAGKMPKWAYYQQNGRTAEENYIEQKKAFQFDFETELQSQLEKALPEALENALDEILNGFGQ